LFPTEIVIKDDNNVKYITKIITSKTIIERVEHFQRLVVVPFLFLVDETTILVHKIKDLNIVLLIVDDYCYFFWHRVFFVLVIMDCAV
jgi:hypothetical protein